MRLENAAMPIVAAAALLLGGWSTLYVDWLDQMREEDDGVPVLIRYVSYTIWALRRRPHWIFLTAIAIFAPAITVTAMWQAQLADDDGIENGLTIFGALFGVTGFLTALLPMGTTLGSLVHYTTASSFVAFGFVYGSASIMLADERGHRGLAVARAVLWYGGLAGALLTALTVQRGVVASNRLDLHRDTLSELKRRSGDEEAVATEDTKEAAVSEEGRLPPAELLRERRWQAAFGASQALTGVFLGLLTATAAADVVDADSGDPEPMVAGIVVGAGSLGLSLAFVLTNNRWIQWCQPDL